MPPAYPISFQCKDEHEEEDEEQEPPRLTLATVSPEELANMSPEDRDELYDQTFRLDIPIEKLAAPLLCEHFPDFATEIVAAYLKYTTFVFKVWINYDATARKFYTDRRAQDCGTVILTPAVRAHQRDIGAGQVSFPNVRFDIGTPFRPLAHVIIEIRPTKLNVGPAIDVFFADVSDRNHRVAVNFIRSLSEEFRGMDATDVTEGKDGLNLRDVEKLARHFRPWPSDDEDARRSWKYYDGPWTSARYGQGYVEGFY